MLHSALPGYHSRHVTQTQSPCVSTNSSVRGCPWRALPGQVHQHLLAGCSRSLQCHRTKTKFLRLQLDRLSLPGQKCPGESGLDYATNYSLRKLKMLSPSEQKPHANCLCIQSIDFLGHDDHLQKHNNKPVNICQSQTVKCQRVLNWAPDCPQNNPCPNNPRETAFPCPPTLFFAS